MMSAIEAKKQTSLNKLAVKEAADSVYKDVMAIVAKEVEKAVSKGHYQCFVSTSDIANLSKTNPEAGKLALMYVDGQIGALGYRTDVFTNHSTLITLYWD